jgi:putative transposase
MPNHVHVIVAPGKKDSLGKLFGWVHGRYAQLINQKRQWFGHLWQARFYSTVMDEAHTLAAMRYVELNPVRAGLCTRPEGWRWSSIHAHLGEVEDRLVDSHVLKKILPDWSSYVRASQSEAFNESIRRQTRSGRPMGDDDFIDMVEVVTGRPVRKKPPGPQRSS